MNEEEKSVRTLQDDVTAKGGKLDDHGVVFDTPKNESADQKEAAGPAEMKMPEETEQQVDNAKDSILTNKDDVFDVSGAFSGSGESGSIITDKKRKKGGLGSALLGAITEWTQKAKKQAGQTKLLKEEENAPKVAPAKSRKDTILKASENTVRAPRDDHRVVIEKIRTLDSDARRLTGKPYLIKEKAETETPGWTHTKETDGAQSATPAHVKKKKLTPTSGFSLVAPEVAERTQTLPETGTKRKQKAERPEEEDTKKEPAVKKEHLVARERKQPLTPIPKRRSTPVPSRKEKAQKKKEKQKKKFNWWFLFQGLDRVEKDADLKTTETVDKPAKEDGVITESAAPKTPVAATQQPFHSDAPREAPPQQRVEPESKPELEQHVETAKTQKPAPETEVDTAAEKETESKEEHTTTSTPISRYKLVLSIVIFLAISTGVGAAYYFYGGTLSFDRSPLPTRTATPVTSFFSVDAYVDVPLSENRRQFLEHVADTVRNTDSNVTHIYPTVRETSSEEETNVPASTEQIMDVIDPRAPSGFVRALTEDMMIGSITTWQREPFIILRSQNFDVAFAGMLDWETNMSADLAPLFGPPVSRTYDTDARTLDRAFGAAFQDTVVANSGARVLYDETNTERIIYTFVDRETIVITTNAQALERLIDAIR